MPYLLNLVYALLCLTIAPWIAWQAAVTGKYRQGWAAKLWGHTPRRSGTAPCVWLHAVSVGEVNLLSPLIRQLEQQLPGWEVVISATTQTGYALARQKYAPRTVFYCPLDFSWAVNRALSRLRPDLLVLAELEVWPNLIALAKRRGVRVAVVNGRLSQKSFAGYRRLGPLIRRVFAQLDLVCAQDAEYAERFARLGVQPQCLATTGSMKYDGAQTDRRNPRTQALVHLAGIQADDQVWLAGSTQAPEEAVVLGVYRTLAQEFPRLRLIVVPRHPERFDEVAQLCAQSGLPFQRRSQLATIGANPQARVLLVDTIGELGAWWGAAHLAFVGGSLGNRGGQNMIEPAAFGAAVSFGPKTRNFRDIVAALLDAQAAVVVHHGDDLTSFVRRCLLEPAYAAELGLAAQRLVQRNQGATARTVARLVELAAAPSGLLAPQAACDAPVRKVA